MSSPLIFLLLLIQDKRKSTDHNQGFLKQQQSNQKGNQWLVM